MLWLRRRVPALGSILGAAALLLTLGLRSAPPLEAQIYGVEENVPPGDAHLTLKLRFPAGTTEAERQLLVGEQLYLVGRSGLAHGRSGHALAVEIDEACRIRASGLHQWMYSVQVKETKALTGLDEPLGPFRLKIDQVFYPRGGRYNSGELELERGVRLEGIVVDEADQPVEGADVRAVWGRRSIHGRGRRAHVKSGTDGRFLFENVPSGLGYIEATSDTGPKGRLSGSRLKSSQGATMRARLVLEEHPPGDLPEQSKTRAAATPGHRTADRAPPGPADGGWIDGVMIDGEGESLVGTTYGFVVTHHSGSRVRRNGWPPIVDGAWRVGPLEPGFYRVERELTSVDRHSHINLFEDVEVRAGEVARVVLDERTRNFDSAKARCEGYVTVHGQPVLAAHVTLRDELGVVSRGFTNVEGYFHLAAWEGRRYSLEVRDLISKAGNREDVSLMEGFTRVFRWRLDTGRQGRR